MKRIAILFLLLVLPCLVLAPAGLSGCGNVAVSGDAMGALETSTLEAFGFMQRVNADPNASWVTKVYAEENFVQWRCFARSAKKNFTWGPKLPSEANVVATGACAPYIRLEELPWST